MKNGFRVYDTDTHIDPGADVLERYVDPGFRKRLDDLARYRVAIKSRSTDGGTRHTYRFDQKLYERTLGEAEARPGTGDGRVWRGERRPGPGVVDDRSDNRVLDMDADGDLDAATWLQSLGQGGLERAVLATKIDKLSRSERASHAILITAHAGSFVIDSMR